MRELFFRELTKDLLGPRKGPREQMEKDPRTEYVTGILEPRDYDRGLLDNYSTSDLQSYAPDDEEDEDDNSDSSTEFEIVPVSLDPRALPKSMGISFVISTESEPLIDFCVTWARYVNENGKWVRKPDKKIIHNWNVASKTEEKWDPAPGVRIVLRADPRGRNTWHVSIFLINTTKFMTRSPDTSDHIFQPQIRVNFDDSITLIPVDKRNFSMDEEGQMNLLYNSLQCLARGHMCGATWKEIDPERPYRGGDSSIFIPDDIKELDPADKQTFTSPRTRTEYLPSYTVAQSTVEIENLSGMERADVDAGVLADRYDAEVLCAPLRKIAAQYKAWIENQRQFAVSLHSEQRLLAEQNMSKCATSLARIEEGIDLLAKEDVRLAFCFMNKAMNLQSQWTRKQNLIWRPFQLAFILQCIPGIENPAHNDRSICDLLWYPTGGGKTEAYLGLMIFTLALRRLRNKDMLASGGTTVISRYTLRLLTIQQFRRTVTAITACEVLRIESWKPRGSNLNGEKIWGGQRFGVGLWVGSNVTPNNLIDREGFNKKHKVPTRYVGAIGLLKYSHKTTARPNEELITQGEEPAQVLKCPVCSSILSVPAIGLIGKEHQIYWIVSSDTMPLLDLRALDFKEFGVVDAKSVALHKPGYYVIWVRFTAASGKLTDELLCDWWKQHIERILHVTLECASASRPGYFIRVAQDAYRRPVDYEIHCPNPECDLNRKLWWELVPGADGKPALNSPLEPFADATRSGFSHGIPIPAFTTDAQIYSRCPSVIIATVDKFARLPFEPQSAAIFGNVDHYDSLWGYYRSVSPPYTGKKPHPGRIVQVTPFNPPELIVQDELHLIEGPLGSMVGLYETAVDALATSLTDGKPVSPKYVASTATTRQASTQVKALFNRELRQFPSPGITALDSFFSSTKEGHPLDESAGRLYVGVCCPGKGPQTPTVRIWASLLQQAERLRLARNGKVEGDLAYYWTVVGYFNAIRELAQARGLYRQDIPGWMGRMDGLTNARSIEDPKLLELYSNIDPSSVSAVIETLEKTESMTDAVMATSMFGTGVDIDRLSLMIVHGQPKTTASYIQATGRVGRKKGALVVTFLRSTRPRDLDHYEFFTGYHRALHRYVEPVTVAPFSPIACDRGLGAVAVAILRNGRHAGSTTINPDWAPESEYWKGASGTSGSRRMSFARSAPELKVIEDIVEVRATDGQPVSRRRQPLQTSKELEAFFGKWENVARLDPTLFYYEPSFNYLPSDAVVLGDAQHVQNRKRVVCESTPQSLRQIESTTRFRG